MTPKLILVALLIGALGCVVWVARERFVDAIAARIVEVFSAVFWGWLVYVIAALPFNMDRLESWTRLWGLLAPFSDHPSGSQFLAVLIGSMVSLFHFREMAGMHPRDQNPGKSSAQRGRGTTTFEEMQSAAEDLAPRPGSSGAEGTRQPSRLGEFIKRMGRTLKGWFSTWTSSS